MEINRNTINIPELRRIINCIISHVENDLQIKEIDLTEDYYWNIPDDVLYMGEIKEDELAVGSLYADLDFLMPILGDEKQAFPLMLIHVAPILRYLALKVEGSQSRTSQRSEDE